MSRMSKIEPSNPFREGSLGVARARAHGSSFPPTGSAAGLLVAADDQQHTWPTNLLIDRAERHTKLLH